MASRPSVTDASTAIGFGDPFSITSQASLAAFNFSFTLANSTFYDPNVTRNIRIIESPQTGSVKAQVLDEEARAKFEKGFMERLDADRFEPGVKSSTEYYVEQWLSTNPFLVQTSIGRFFLSNTSHVNRLVGVLSVVAHLDKKALSPANELIALAALSHSSVEVKEYALRAYEYWEDPVLVAKLKDFSIQPAWLEEYKNEIIEDVIGG